MPQHVKKVLDVPNDLPAPAVVAAMAQTWQAARLLATSLGVKRDLFQYEEAAFQFLSDDGFGRPSFRVRYDNVGPHSVSAELSLWHQPHAGAISPIDDMSTNICVVATFVRRRPEVVRLCDDFANLMSALPQLDKIVRKWPLGTPSIPPFHTEFVELDDGINELPER